MSTISDMLDGYSGIISQADKITQSTDAPILETVEATDLASDGSDFADELFSIKAKTPVKRMYLQEAYDMSQAYSRIMQLYSASRTDFYDNAVSSNDIRATRYTWKADVLDRLNSYEDEDT